MGAAAFSWPVTDGHLSLPSGESPRAYVGVGGPDVGAGGRFGWSESFEGTPSVGPVIDLGARQTWWRLFKSAEFSGGMAIGGECGMPSWVYAAESGRFVVETVTAEAVRGTLTATLVAERGPYSRRVKGSARVRALVSR